jgi:hypothetical protein
MPFVCTPGDAPQLQPTTRSSAVLFAIAAVLTSVFFIDFCDWVYDCGCRSLWAGAASHCNIHRANVRHCPWCSIGSVGTLGIYAAILGVQAVAVRMVRGSAPTRLLFAVAAFPAVGGVIALILGWKTGYWNKPC